MKVLHLDRNHPLLIEELAAHGCENWEEYEAPAEALTDQLAACDGIIIRSRIPLDRGLLEKAGNLKFIGRLGAGLENIDTEYAADNGIFLAAAPEGNRNAVGEHALGMLLALMNRMHTADREVRDGIWEREGNRGWELDGRTVGIIGYGNTGSSFAQKLQGFRVRILCTDIVPHKGDSRVEQVDLATLRKESEIISLHIPQTPDTLGMINRDFIQSEGSSFWLINTARGKAVVTADLVEGLRNGRVRGAALDVLEYEKSSFGKLGAEGPHQEDWTYLKQAPNVLLSPHVAGWTHESKERLARVVLDKLVNEFGLRKRGDSSKL